MTRFIQIGSATYINLAFVKEIRPSPDKKETRLLLIDKDNDVVGKCYWDGRVDDFLTSRIIPASPGTFGWIIVCSPAQEDGRKPVIDDVYACREMIVGWMVGDTGLAKPIITDEVSDDVFIELPGGVIREQHFCDYSSIEAAKLGVLQAAQEVWARK